jgi:hypothetical protein
MLGKEGVCGCFVLAKVGFQSQERVAFLSG